MFDEFNAKKAIHSLQKGTFPKVEPGIEDENENVSKQAPPE